VCESRRQQSGDCQFRGNAADGLKESGAAVARRAMSAHQFVGAFGVITRRQSDGIAGIAQPDEIDALDDAFGIGIEAGMMRCARLMPRASENSAGRGARVAAFFRMELHGVDIFVLDHGSEFRAMRAGRCSRAMLIERGVGMRKIKIGASVDVCEEGRLALFCDLIPAHVRELYGWRQSGNDSGQQIQALELPGFFAGLKKYLQTKTDSQEGNTTLNGVD